jgi:transcriptional regulator with XRE-family HTH domain
MELGRFLRARRTQITPGQVGLTVGTGLRRTPGLRREELATLAGISIDYYVRLERGKETRPSPSVLDAVARALRLDDAEHQHQHPIARYVFRHPAAREVLDDWQGQARGCVARLRALADTAPDLTRT